MAKELPYFRFTAQEWQNGDISLERFELRGLFIDVCCYYWLNDCSIAREKLEKRYINDLDLLNELISLDIILWDKESDFVQISFLNDQFDVLSEQRKRRQEAGSKGGKQKSSNAKAKPKQSSSYKDKDKDKYTIEREVLKSVYLLFDESHYNTDPKKKKWLDTIRLCLNNDKRDKQQLIDVIKFARTDEFWKGNFLTINSLRKKNSDGIMKYDSILAKMPKQKKPITGKYPEATYEQIATGLASEFQAKENIKQGIRYVMNGPMLTKVRTDSTGDYIFNSKAEKERL